MVSSSCSYASAALAKTLFARGADFTASMAFMIASTNLVVELGAVVWLLIGWQFALAEFVGGTIMIILIGVSLPRLVPPAAERAARARLTGEHGHDSAGDSAGDSPRDSADDSTAADSPRPDRLRTRRGWADAAGYTVSDLAMLYRELVIGFVVAGYLAALVPTSFWRGLFIAGHGFASSLENAVLGPFLAIISFVCSVGNVPLAAALWQGGIGFGGVVSFIFADLITLPLLLIYRKYFGSPLTVRILATFWASMTVAGLATEYGFRALGVPDPARGRNVVRTGFAWDYTTVLNLVALGALAVVGWLYRQRDSGGGFAKDPVCGMQVEIALAPASRAVDGARVYFCSDHCAQRFDSRAGAAGHTAPAR